MTQLVQSVSGKSTPGTSVPQGPAPSPWSHLSVLDICQIVKVCSLLQVQRLSGGWDLQLRILRCWRADAPSDRVCEYSCYSPLTGDWAPPRWAGAILSPHCHQSPVTGSFPTLSRCAPLPGHSPPTMKLLCNACSSPNVRMYQMSAVRPPAQTGWGVTHLCSSSLKWTLRMIVLYCPTVWTRVRIVEENEQVRIYFLHNLSLIFLLEHVNIGTNLGNEVIVQRAWCSPNTEVASFRRFLMLSSTVLNSDIVPPYGWPGVPSII